MRVQTQFLLINIIGGIAVLGGYVIALINNPETRNELWGGVPENLRLWITAFMFISALGYCFAMYYLIFDEGLSLGFFWGKFDYKLIKALLIIFLTTAALWIHTTFLYMESGSKFHWSLVQIELWLTGASVFLIMIGFFCVFKLIKYSLSLNFSLLPRIRLTPCILAISFGFSCA